MKSRKSCVHLLAVEQYVFLIDFIENYVDCVSDAIQNSIFIFPNQFIFDPFKRCLPVFHIYIQEHMFLLN